MLMTENELLLNKIKDLEIIVDDVQLLKAEMQRSREKNSTDWNYWRKQQSDLYAQLRQQQFLKESILNKFDRLQKQVSLVEQSNFDRSFFVHRSNLMMFMTVDFVISASVQYLSIVFKTKQRSKQVYRILVGKHYLMIVNFPMKLSMDDQRVQMKFRL